MRIDQEGIVRFLDGRFGALFAMTLVTATGFALVALLPGERGGLTSWLAMVAMMLSIAWLKGTRLREFGLQRPRSWPRTLALGVAYACVAFVLFRIGAEPLLERATGTGRDLSRFGYLRGNLGALLALLPQLWLTAALFEEMYFRGFLINGLAQALGRSRPAWALAVAVSSLFFAVLHGYQGAAGLLLTGMGAVFLSLVYLGHGRNLWIPFIAHGLHDASAAVMFYLGVYPRIVHALW